MSTLTKRLSKSKSFTVLMLLTIITFMFSSPLSALASTQNSEDCNCGVSDGDFNENDVNYIEGEEKSEVLRGIEASTIFENNVNHNSINDDLSIVINLGEHDYANGDVLQVSSVFEKSTDGNYYDSITAFVEQDTNKVLKLSYFEIDAETVHYKDFDERGQLMIHQEFSYEDFVEGNLDNPITHHSFYDSDQIGIQSGPSGFWEAFACNFSGMVACYSGCSFALLGGPGGYALCTAACQLVWGSGLC
ncbi:hypothetical protein M3638_05260 [Oceanobacillus profundus]|uniref:hypothetical protein n=1 Tax=Oceanobacillus profundus TaxID=372463 RepID=UPI000BA5F1C9|nr:hypothetical protein [Oceanobacillus profundus]MCM3397244.1 hypothetical protein [Oceanobacillus profundus]PAE28633.1 hypothetical protein CHI07_13080 [Paenibacillus sp. 7884-2]